MTWRAVSSAAGHGLLITGDNEIFNPLLMALIPEDRSSSHPARDRYLWDLDGEDGAPVWLLSEAWMIPNLDGLGHREKDAWAALWFPTDTSDEGRRKILEWTP